MGDARKMRENVFLKTGDLEGCSNKAVFKDLDYTKWETEGSDSSFIKDEKLEEGEEDMEQDDLDEEYHLDEEVGEEIQDVYQADEEVSD